MTATVVQDKATDEETQPKAGDEALQRADEEAKHTTGVKDIVGEAEEHKARGNGLLKDGKYTEAVDAYTKAIDLHPVTAVFWSNRSHANLKAGRFDAALRDAEEAVSLQPTWAKGHHRKAKVLQEMGSFAEAAAACSQGAKAAAGSSEASEVKLLERLQAELILEAAKPAVLGWWHGKVSAALGGFDQEFNFLTGGKLQCVVYGQELDGTYKLSSVEKSKGGGFIGGLDVNLNDTKVPYLFKVGDGDSMLHMCCPMNSPELRPRTFDGPGYLGMRSGRLSGGDAAILTELKELSEGQRIVRYLDELMEVMEANPAMQEIGGGDAYGAQAAELLEESGPGTLSASQLGMQESLEDKQKKLQREQTMSALRLKYTAEIEEQAQKLIKREVKPATLYSPEEVKELEKRLRRFEPKKEPQSAVVEEPQSAVAEETQSAASQEVEQSPQFSVDTVSSSERPKKIRSAWIEENDLTPANDEASPEAAQPKMRDASEMQEAASSQKKAPQRNSCWQGCFAGLTK